MYLSVVTSGATWASAESVQGALVVPLSDGLPDDVAGVRGGSCAGDEGQVLPVPTHLVLKHAPVGPVLGEHLQLPVHRLTKTECGFKCKYEF